MIDFSCDNLYKILTYHQDVRKYMRSQFLETDDTLDKFESLLNDKKSNSENTGIEIIY